MVAETMHSLGKMELSETSLHNLADVPPALDCLPHDSLSLAREHAKEFQPARTFADVDKTCERKASTHRWHHRAGGAAQVFVPWHEGCLKS